MAPRYPLTDGKYDRFLLRVYRNHLCLLQHGRQAVLLSQKVAGQRHQNFEVSKLVQNACVEKRSCVGLGPKRTEKHAVQGGNDLHQPPGKDRKSLSQVPSASPAHGAQLQGGVGS